MSNSGKTLTKSQSLYCSNRAGGEMTKVDCYLNAYPRCKSKESAKASWQMLEKQPHIQEEIKRLQDATETSETLTRQEKRVFLARCVRVNGLAIDPEDSDDENADLVMDVKRSYDKEGNHVGTAFKLPSKLGAVEIDNKMAGHNEPDEVNHTHGGGVMLVPIGGESLDEWEKDAVKQQKGMVTPTDEKAP